MSTDERLLCQPQQAADEALSLSKRDFQSPQQVKWCPGCGSFAVLGQVQNALAEMGVPREKAVFVSGIGCSSRFPYYMNTYGIHGIHGRAPALAWGVKCAQPDLSVWVVTGDGDGLSIGGNHLIHCMRRNLDVNILLLNNQVYGLTKGQYSPTSPYGTRTKSSPSGTIEQPIHPVQIALAAEATFVARTVFSDTAHMARILAAAARHRGTAFIEILQNCVVFADGAFTEVTDRRQRDAHRILLEDGEPIRFGSDGRQGIVLRGLEPAVVTLGEEGAAEEDLLVHNAKTPSRTLAALLASLEPPQFPQAFGIFRQLEKPTYDGLLMQQIHSAVEKNGRGDLARLLGAGTTWYVD